MPCCSAQTYAGHLGCLSVQQIPSRVLACCVGSIITPPVNVCMCQPFLLLMSVPSDRPVCTVQMCGEEDVDPNGPCQQYTEANDVLRDLRFNLRDDKLLLMKVLASVWRKVMHAG